MGVSSLLCTHMPCVLQYVLSFHRLSAFGFQVLVVVFRSRHICHCNAWTPCVYICSKCLSMIVTIWHYTHMPCMYLVCLDPQNMHQDWSCYSDTISSINVTAVVAADTTVSTISQVTACDHKTCVSVGIELCMSLSRHVVHTSHRHVCCRTNGID